MFVRAKHFDGRTYYYLVENTRVGDRVVQKVIKYLGKNKSSRGLAAVFILLFLGLGHALNCSWTGVTSTNYSVSTNWNCGSVPGVDDTATLNATPSNQPVMTVSSSLYQLHMVVSSTFKIDAVTAGRDVALTFKDSVYSGFMNYSQGTFNASGSSSYRAIIQSASGWNPTDSWNFRQDTSVYLNYVQVIGSKALQRMTGTAGTWSIRNVNFTTYTTGAALGTYPRPATILAIDNLTINATITGYALVFYGGITLPAVMNNVVIYGGPSHDVYVLQGVKPEFNNSTFNEKRVFCSDGEGGGRLISKNHNGIPGNYLIYSSNATPVYKSQIVNDFGPNDNVTLMEPWYHNALYSTGLIIDENASAANLTLSPRTSLRVMPGVTLNVSNNTVIDGLFDANNNGLLFDGSDDYVNVPSSASLNPTSITLEAWIRPASDWSAASATNPGIFHKYTGATGYLLYLESSTGTITLYLPHANYYCRTAARTLKKDSPLHVIALYNATSGGCYMYLNGTLDGSGSTSGNIATNAPDLWIGRYSQTFNGTIYGARIYNRDISTTEISEHYRGIFSNDAGLAGYWHLDEGRGSLVYDRSGNANTGTINGAAWMMPNISTGSLAVNSSGRLNATMGTTIISNGNLVNKGVFINASGTVRFTGNGYIIGTNTSNALGNLVIDSGDNVTHMADGIAVNGSVTVNGLLDSRQDALSFDGNDYVVATGVSVNTAVGTYNTVEFWMLWDGIESGMPFRWASNYDLYFAGGCFGFNTYEANVLGFPNTGLASGWKHIAAVFYNGVPSASTNKLYIDGVERPLTNCLGATTVNQTADTTIYISDPTTYGFRGKIDEVRIYSRILSPTEVLDHYHNLYPNESGLVGKWRFEDEDTEYPNTTSLAGHWHFNEGAGTTTADSSGNSNSGTITGATQAAPGKFGYAMAFDGVNDYVNVPDSASLDTTTGFTAEAWIRLNKLGAYQGIMDKSLYHDSGYYFRVSNGNVLQIAFEVPGTNDALYSNTSLALDTWYHVAATYDGSRMRVYLNGVMENNKISAVGLYANGQVLKLGWEAAGYFNGSIDEVAIHNRALEPDEIRAHASRRAFDSSGNNDNGTISGSTWIAPNANYSTLTINYGGTYNATNGITNLTGDGIRIYGNFSHNRGTVLYSKPGNGFFNGPMYNAVFYNVVSAHPYNYNVRNTYSHTIINQLNVTNGNYDIDGNGYTTTLTMGSATQSGRIYTNSANRFRFLNGGATAGVSVVTAASPAYPWIATGGDWDWDGWVGNGITDRLRWGDIQFDATTGGSGITLDINGNMTLDGLTVPNGATYNDILNITTPGVVLTGNSAKSITVSGVANISGSSSAYVEMNGFKLLYVPTVSTMTSMKYLKVNAGDIAGATPLWLNSQVPVVENCIFNKSVLGDGVVLSSTYRVYSFRNTTFSGYSGALARNQQIYVWGDASHTNYLRCSNCVFDTVGFEYPAGWVYSKQHNGDPAQTKVWGNFSYTQDFLKYYGDMQGYWKLDEGSGSVAVDYAGLTNGTVTNTSGWTAGRFNRAIAFDGLDDSVDIPRNFTYIKDFTISSWVKIRGRHKNYDGAIVSSGDWNTAHWSLSIAQNNDAVSVRLSDLGIVLLSKTFAFNTSRWYNVALTRNGTNLTFWVDGQNIGSSTVNASTLKSGYSNTMIGRETYAGGYFAFNGTIDEVAIFSRALQPSEFPPSEHDETLSVLPSSSMLTVPAGIIAIFNNVTENGTISVAGALYRYKDYPIFVVNGSNVGVAGASVNVSDNYTGGLWNVTGNSAGWAYPGIFVSLTNGSTITTVWHNLSAAKSGQWNNVLANSSRGNHTIILGSTQGYSIIGNVSASGFTPNVTVGGSPLAGPYSGIQPVEIRNGSQPVATFQHDFSSGDLDLNAITVKLGQYWVGFDGALPATLYVPLRGTYCNVHVCTGITNQSETCSAGWEEWSSDPQGWYCLTTINGTVAEEQVDPGVTRLVAAPVRPEAVIALFAFAILIFFMSGRKGK